ncbi:MAG: PQQ-binding-like beta-propeller repeat protein [Pirellulaceae bacterium]
MSQVSSFGANQDCGLRSPRQSLASLFLVPAFGFVAVCFLCSVTRSALAEDWNRFRGPTGQGIAEADLPIEFGLDSAVRWKVPIPGKGWSSPVIADGRIWLTTAVTEPATEEQRKAKLAGDRMAGMKEVAGSLELSALCIDFETGEILKHIPLAKVSDPDPIHPLNSFASPTPVLDSGKVYCDFGNYGTWCLDAESGEKIWERQYVVSYSVGPGSSPLIIGNKLILVCDGTDEQFVVALDKETGQEVWKTARPPKEATDGEYRKSYCSPLEIKVAGQSQVVIPSAQWTCSYDPEVGNEIWRVDHGRGFSLSSAPIESNGLVLFSTGYMKPELVAIDPTGSGDVTKTHQKWRVSRGVPNKPSPIAAGGSVYMISDKGVLTRLDGATGEVQWQERLGGQYSASPILASGRIYLSSHEGIVTVVEDGEEYVELAKNEMEPRLMASPAVVGNELVIRSEESLYRIGK